MTLGHDLPSNDYDSTGERANSSILIFACLLTITATSSFQMSFVALIKHISEIIERLIHVSSLFL